jgi:hypothetical protein
MSSPYNLVLPTSVEPICNLYGASYPTGWTENSRPVFKLSFQNKELRPKSIRLNGMLQKVILVSSVSANWRAVTVEDKVYLDPNAGANGFIYVATTKSNKSIIESIVDYNKFVAMKNEFKYYQIDHATSTDSMLELMSFSNDAKADDQIKYNANSSMQYPIDAGTAEQPFSIDLDICLNGSEESIPYSKIGDVEIELILASVGNSGMIYKGSANTANGNVQLGYVWKNLEIRYLTDEEQAHSGAIVLETKSASHIPTIQNRISAVEYAPSHSFDSIVGGLRVSGNSDNFTNSNLQSVALLPLVDFMEVKVNGQDDSIQFPLRLQTAEILYNALLAWNPYIHEYTDTRVLKHGASYSKLSNGSTDTLVQSGWALGCAFHGGHEAGTRVSFTLTLKQAPATPYQCYLFNLGRLVI